MIVCVLVFARPNDSASAQFLQDPDTELPDDDAFSEEAKPLNGLCSMPPAPPIHQVLEDGSEEVVFPRSIFQMDDFTMALALWCEEAGIPRAKHKALLEVLDLLDDGSRKRLLPRSLATLKHNLKSSLPLTKIRKKQIPLTAEKLSSMTPA